MIPAIIPHKEGKTKVLVDTGADVSCIKENEGKTHNDQTTIIQLADGELKGAKMITLGPITRVESYMNLLGIPDLQKADSHPQVVSPDGEPTNTKCSTRRVNPLNDVQAIKERLIRDIRIRYRG